MSKKERNPEYASVIAPKAPLFSWQNIAAFVVALAIGFALGALWNASGHRAAAGSASSGALREGGYQFINPLLACDVNGGAPTREDRDLEAKLSSAIGAMESAHSIDAASVYYRNLGSSQWADINPDATYSLASLGKVPIMLAYYRESEKESGLLGQRFLDTETSDLNAQQEISPEHSVQAGESYSATDLIKSMILYSDNNAADILYRHLDPSLVSETYSDLDISIPSGAVSGSDVITPRRYGLFFRVLYNGTFTTRDNSEDALKLLSQTSFDKGLVAGVPAGTVVAHKFGLTSVGPDLQDIAARELHDCGIVYAPKNPYLLCVMTKSSSTVALAEKAIADISSLVYQAQ